MPSKNTILEIVVNRPLFQSFDYQYQGELTPKVGSRVKVPFGASRAYGIIIKIKDSSPFKSLKKIDTLIDKEPILELPIISLLTWASRYYHQPIGEVFFNALPINLRQGKALPDIIVWKATKTAIQNIASLPVQAHKQKALLEFLLTHNNGISEVELNSRFEKQWRAQMKVLEAKAFVEKSLLTPQRDTEKSLTVCDEITLTDEQTESVKTIISITQDKSPKPVLLHGITGSGKTEVYLRAILPLIEQKKQILVIVPEIGLTPQLLDRFQQFFVSCEIVMLHSALSNGERTKAWYNAQTGKADIIIGTRSAIFVPLPHLAMIIVDEEHDLSLKQQEGFRYHARDLAVKRAHQQSIPIILGSATPSIESIHNSDRNRYHYLRLSRRPGSRVPPNIQVTDIKGQSLECGLSSQLLEQVSNHLESGNQVMLFLNRRGFAPALYCSQCGWYAECSNCDAKLTYHALSRKLRCHHCGYERAVFQSCPECAHPHITTQGTGTERLEHYLQTLYSDIPIVRIDRDSTSRKGTLQKKLNDIHTGQPMIIVGTQMLAKGHDFPNLTLVGILDIDQSLFSTDFRAIEQLAQLIVQVSGRAGRANKKGTVMLQSCQTKHPVFETLLSKGYLALAKQLITERQNWYFPPFSHQALIRANGINKAQTLEILNTIKAMLNYTPSPKINILGPAPSPMEKKANKFRAQLLVTSDERPLLHQMLNNIVNQNKIIKKGNVDWSIDIDPMSYD